MRNRGPMSHFAVDIPFRQQLLVGKVDRVASDSELVSKRTCGRQPCSGCELSCQNSQAQPIIQLAVKRDGRGSIEHNHRLGAEWYPFRHVCYDLSFLRDSQGKWHHYCTENWPLHQGHYRIRFFA